MADREKVIKGLECCSQLDNDDICPAECPYAQDVCCGTVQLMADALELLKAQEPVKPKWEKGYAYCGQCGYKLHWIVERNNFCPNCGKAVKWDG